MEDITYIGITNFRNKFEHFGIKTDDRRRHMYLIGKTGVGKTTMLENMIVQDIQKGRGVGVIDPHGELISRILHFIPKARVDDVLYFNPADISWPIAFNVIEEVPKEWRHLVVAGLMGVFKKIWPDVWSARMEYILNNALLALLEYPQSTLLGVNRLLSDADFRKAVVEKITDPVVKAFWEKEFSSYNQRYASEAVAPIQNKIGQFISNPLIRNIIGQRESKIDFREIMDGKKIFLANLSKGLIGEDNSDLLGALIITKMQLAAMSRVELSEEERSDFYLYVDEFQNFSTESFANIFAEARKYRLNLILAHQYINQLNEKVRDAIFGNIGTLVCYRVGPEDAELLEKYFMPEFTKEDLINLPNYHFYIKLMIDGTLSKGFSAINIPPQQLPEISYIDLIIEYSRKLYSREAKEVEREIAYWELLDFKSEKEERKLPYLKKPQEGWEAICSNCGKKIIVPFRPSPTRPIYCEECLRKLRQEKEGKISLKELPKMEVIKTPPKKSSLNKRIKTELPEENKNKIIKILKNIFGQ
ncbi:MAG: type IV secretion system DNA-binding domain-containing protein [Minisyncoccia bacterium]